MSRPRTLSVAVSTRLPGRAGALDPGPHPLGLGHPGPNQRKCPSTLSDPVGIDLEVGLVAEARNAACEPRGGGHCAGRSGPGRSLSVEWPWGRAHVREAHTVTAVPQISSLLFLFYQIKFILKGVQDFGLGRSGSSQAGASIAFTIQCDGLLAKRCCWGTVLSLPPAPSAERDQ